VTAASSAAAAIMFKELRVEFRSKQMINSYLILAVLILASFRFAFAALDLEGTDLAAPILWITIFFAGMFSLAPAYKREADGATKAGLLLAPIPRSAIYFGKLAASLIVVACLELFTTVVFFAFFPFAVPDLAALGALLALGTVGFVALGSIISAISANLSQAEVMLPVLLVPLLLFTVVMSAVAATSEVFRGAGLADVMAEVRFLAAFALVFVTAGYLLIGHIMEA
jgi:heme exporter protein B